METFDAWDVLVRAAHEHGERQAVLDLGNQQQPQQRSGERPRAGAHPSRSCTYRELYERCCTAAHFLAATQQVPTEQRRHRAPVQPGDRVAVMLQNSPAFLEMHFVAAGLRRYAEEQLTPD
jgi:acyl-CoA synthetase (AMP-forming)/AMP-acid ligase II